VFCGFKLNLACHNNTVARATICYKKLILKEYFYDLCKLRFVCLFVYGNFFMFYLRLLHN